MESHDALDVPFCDLCNASVPLQDLEQGSARRHLGKTVGACCLPALTGAGLVGAVDAKAADGKAAAAPGVGAPRGAAPATAHDPRLLPIGIAVLAGLAAVAIFLDYRLQTLEGRNEQQFTLVAEDQKVSGDLMRSVSVAMDTVAQRRDVDAVTERVSLLDAAQTRLGDQLRTMADQHASRLAALQQNLQELQRSRPDYGPVLTELRLQLQQQAVTLAELKALPRAREPEPAAPVASTPAPVPGISPALSHQIGRLKDADPATRFEAVDELLRSKEPAILEHLLPMAKDEDTFVRRLTVEGLKDFRQAAAVDALLVALADPVEIVRDTAFRSLKDLTGQKLPFDATAPRDSRARMQQRWQEWWEKNRETFGS